MRGVLAKLCKKNGIAKRVVSMSLALLMVLSTLQALPAGILVANAAEGDTNITLHFYNGNWKWTTPGLEYWSGSAEVSGATAADITYSAENVKPGWQLNADGDDWYSITLKGDFAGFQFVDLASPSERNTSGKGYDAKMAQYTEDAPKDLYFKESDNTWYLDSSYSTPVPEVAGAITSFDVVIHYNNTTSDWEKVYAYAWTGYSTADWPGVEMTANSSNTGWYDITFRGVLGNTLEFKFNAGENLPETGNCKYVATTNTVELWYDGAISDKVPESGWTRNYSATVHWLNTPGWENVAAHKWNVGGLGDLTSWPGAPATATEGKDGWYETTATGLTSNKFGVIFTDGAQNTSNKTANIEVELLSENTEMWVTGTKETPVVHYTAPQEWAPKTYYDVTLHYKVPFVTGWTNTYAHVWDNHATVTGGWPGTDAAIENSLNAGWYDLVLDDKITDKNIGVILNNNSEKTGNLTCELKDSSTELWVTGDSISTAALTDKAPEGWISATKTLKINYYNSEAWDAVCAWAWNVADSKLNYTGGKWPGKLATKSSESTDDKWWNVSVTGIERDTSQVAFCMNNNDNKKQTADLLATMTDANVTEVWVVGTTVLNEKPTDSEIEEILAKTYEIKIHYHNRYKFENVYLNLAETSEWSTIKGYEDYREFPGSKEGVTANSEHPGWYDFTLVKKNESETYAIFSNGKTSNAGGVQTSNLKINITGDTTEVWIDGELTQEEVFTEAPASWNDPSVAPTPAPESNSYVTDLMEVKIGSNTYAMDVYANGWFEAVVNLPAGTHAVTLYKNGKETEQTTSITLDNAADVSVLYVNAGEEMFKASKVSDYGTWSVVGGMKDLGYSDWKPDATDMNMTYVGGGLYKVTLEFGALPKDTTVEYKAVKGHAWGTEIHNGSGGNVAVTIPKGSTSLTIYADLIQEKLYDSVRSTFTAEGAKYVGFDTTISLIGNVRHIGADDWNTNTKGWEFTPISDTLYRFDYVIETAGSDHPYKIVYNYSVWPQWADVPLTTYKDNTHVIFVYDATTGSVYDSVNDNDKVARLLGMTASPIEGRIIDNFDGTVTFVTGAASGQEVELYYADTEDVEANGASAFEKVDMSTVIARKSTGTVTFGDSAIDILYYYTIDGVTTLDGSNETITVNGQTYMRYTREASGGRVVNLPGGNFPGVAAWDAATNQMTYLGDGIYALTFKNMGAATYEYKVAIGGSWAENYGANGELKGANIQLTVPSVQDVTIYYSDVTHLTASSIDYVFADIDLAGTGIAEGTKLEDKGLTGIYSAEIEVPAGTYNDWQIEYDGQTYDLVDFTLDDKKTVKVYMDIATLLYYHDAIDLPLETTNIYFDSKDPEYKSVFGAVATGESVKFSIQTGTDVTGVALIVRGVEKKTVTLEKDGTAVDGKQKWSGTTSFSAVGENDYYFTITNGATVSIYCDDDEYYGTGKVATLTEVLPYDLVVYKSGFKTPDWMKNAVIYQIFPDRFADGDTSNNDAQRTARGAVNYEWITDWYTIPENPEQKDLVTQAEYEAKGAHWGDGQWSNEIYGGDLKGITDNIDYLKELGVTVIYLNPVFSSISSHRYDACDYMAIDPVLGTLGDFEELVTIAEQNGMKVVLDGVFNHVSDDSIYFDRYYKFLGDEGLTTIGAYPYWAFVYDYMADYGTTQAVAEAAAKNYFTTNYGVTDYSYTEWFEVFNEAMSDGKGGLVYDTIGWRKDRPVYGYEGWWGYDSMPIIKSTNGSEYQTGDWANDIIYNAQGTSVTQYWISKGMDGWRLDVANEVSDETWQHFRDSVKALDSEAVIIGEIWTDATKYILGDMYDSVMNYMFRNAVTGFAMGTDATKTTKEMEKIRERYPKEAFYAMMNLVGSHDTSRILSYLDGVKDDRDQKDLDSAFPTYAGTSDKAKQMQYLVAFLQFTYAGAPTIYYGDEIGMVGGDDPDDRRAFEWGKGNAELVTYYATLAAVRNNYSALRTGSVETFDTGKANVLGYVRRDTSDAIIVLANNSATAQSVTIDLSKLNVTADVLVDLLSDTEFTVSGTTATVSVPARRGLILVDDGAVKEISVTTTALKRAYDPAYIVDERADFTDPIVGNDIIDEVPVTPPSSGGTGSSSTSTPDSDATTGAGNGAQAGINPGTPTKPADQIKPDTEDEEQVKVEVETDAATEVPETVTDITPVVDEKLQNAIANEAEKILEDIINDEISEEVMSEETLENVKEAQKNGEGILTEVIVDKLDEASVDADVKEALEKALTESVKDKKGAETKIAQYLDLTVLLKTTKGQMLGEINKLSKDMTFTIAVPEELVKEGRVFVVLRMHEGETTVLETTMNSDGTLSFKTDRFSTYALAYVDAPAEEVTDDDTTTEGDVPSGSTTTEEEGGNNVATFIIVGLIIVIIAALVIIFLAMKRKKDE